MLKENEFVLFLNFLFEKPSNNFMSEKMKKIWHMFGWEEQMSPLLQGQNVCSASTTKM
jgi:hypothetical protein